MSLPSTAEPREALPRALFIPARVSAPHELTNTMMSQLHAAVPGYSFDVLNNLGTSPIDKVIDKLTSVPLGEGYELVCGFGDGCEVVCGVMRELESLEVRLPRVLRKFALFGPRQIGSFSKQLPAGVRAFDNATSSCVVE